VLDFSNDALLAAEKGFFRLMEGMDSLKNIAPGLKSTLDVASWRQECYDAMNDDFNAPILIAQLFEGVRFINLMKDRKETLTESDLAVFADAMNAFVFDVLGLENAAKSGQDNRLEGTVNMLIAMRNEARANRNWALS